MSTPSDKLPTWSISLDTGDQTKETQRSTTRTTWSGNTATTKRWVNGKLVSTSTRNLKPPKDQFAALIFELFGTFTMTPAEKKWLAEVKARNLPVSTFLNMIRRYDPRYIRTDDYRNRRADALDLWRTILPGQRLNRDFLDSYARSGRSRAWAREQLMYHTKQGRNLYRFMTTAAQVGSAAASSPQAYRAYTAALLNSFQNRFKRNPTLREAQMYFHSGMTGNQFDAELANLLGGASALKWAIGYLPPQKDFISAALGVKGSTQMEQKLGRAAAVQSSFMGSKNTPFGWALNESEQITRPRI